jgi:hypothetical protein
MNNFDENHYGSHSGYRNKFHTYIEKNFTLEEHHAICHIMWDMVKLKYRWIEQHTARGRGWNFIRETLTVLDRLK